MAKDNALPLILAGAAAFLLLGRGGSGCTPVCTDIRADGGTVAGIDYLEYRSKGLGPNDPAPMIIAFHGFGTPTSALDGLKGYVGMAGGPVRLIVPMAPRRTTKQGYHTWFGMNRAGQQDQAKLADIMLQVHGEVAEFICQITQCRPTEGKPIVVGSSQGGMMSYLLATRSAGDIRGAVLAAGWLPQSLWSAEVAPIYATHGTQDTIVPYTATAQYWATLHKYGAPLETKTYDQGHVAVGPSWRRARIQELLGYA